MRNLVVINEVHGVVEGDDDSKLQIAAAAVDVDNGLFFVVSQSSALLCYSLSSSKVEWIVTLDEEGGPVVAMDWRVEVESVVIGRSSGQVVEVSDSGQEVQEVGSLKGGLLAMAASPDGELLLLATGFGQLLVMTQDWDLLYEVTLDEGLAASGSVQLSWRGDGKYFATLVTGSGASTDSSPLKIWERDTGALYASGESIPYLQTAMSWCPSGARIGTACIQPNSTSQPLIMSFEKNGLKRDKFQLEGPLDTHVNYLKWNSNSELLAMVITTKDWTGVQIWSCSNFHWYLKQELRFPSTDELNVLWDPEDPMTLVCWTASGTIRTLKLGWKSAVLDSSIALVINGLSLLVSPLSLALIPPPMSLFTITFQAPVQVVAFLQDHERCCFIAARLSDSTLSVVTLPELNDWLDLDGINHTAHSISVLSDLKQSISELRHLTWLSSGALLGALSVQPGSDKVGISGNFSGTQNGVFFQTYPGSKEILVEVDLDMVAYNPSPIMSDGVQIQGVQETPVKQAVISIIKNKAPLSDQNGDAFVQLGDGSMLLYSESQGASQFGKTVIGKFARPCPWTSVLQSENGETLLLGLDQKGSLELLGRCVLCRDCSSFVVHTAADSRSHLLYTTQRDSMHVVSLSDLSSLSEVQSKQEVNMKPEISDGRKPKGVGFQEENLKVRPLWERGARLVTALGGHDVAVIVQTIRGNLETVYPRGLVLGAIAEALKKGDFREAMGLTRRHHINLNVLVDYGGWRNFCVKASEFVKQVGKLNHITELVYALNEENIVETTYKNLLPPFPEPLSPADAATELMKSQFTANKVQTVLKSLRLGVEKEIPVSPGKELCILATLAKSRPPELKEALQRIKSLREAELQGEVAVELEAVEETGEKGKVILSAEAALKHLLWLSDADIVFKEALGLYDLHLAAMVASHAQRDPKEFIPLLKELEEMPPHLMQYSIDVRLGHYESALQNLAQGGEANFNECLQLMMDHAELFPLGLHIFRESKNRLPVLEAWGDHLMQQEKFEDAAAAYCSCNNLQKALGSYRAGGLWRGVMTIAGRMNLSREEWTSLASDLGEELQAMGMPAEAACVALEYIHDVDSGVRLLLEAREWMEAVRVSSLYAREDLLSSLIESAALECASALIEEFTEGLDKVRKYLLRYQTVRQRRLALAAKLKAEEDGEWVDDDTISEASSHLSSMSAYSHGTAATSSVTTGSGRGRKQSVRSQKKVKGGRIRAGSAGEEGGLVDYIRGMAVSPRMLDEVRRLLSVLVLQGHYSVAHHVQSSLVAYQNDQKVALETMEKDAADDNLQAGNPPSASTAAVSKSSSPAIWRLAVLEPPDGVCI
ncbi:elongator complex protein 1 [Physcomitrium patens]|uniref:Elongator complex protein 1 n=1 Tax=Physcomitrium patens TaxID=3218 RepID=A9RYA1_PHYPA|nr:elongator complex protein 1-like [Physcomitrium patens]PNR49236.1 hypothetical protein PHYPA_011132 [Physcomitrium patens]|eukprot:XP_024381817.1 elongator complex protein 1-like [Physcomitrella patens]